MRANPDPQKTVIDFKRKCAMVNANARRPKFADLLEL